MGFVVKSALGLSVVYVAMFGPPPRVGAYNPKLGACAGVADTRLVGVIGLKEEWSVARCAIALGARANPAGAALTPPKLAARPAPSPFVNTLTQADLREPWYGPMPRKTGWRG